MMVITTVFVLQVTRVHVPFEWLNGSLRGVSLADIIPTRERAD